jgi:hypothetical protein
LQIDHHNKRENVAAHGRQNTFGYKYQKTR